MKSCYFLGVLFILAALPWVFADCPNGCSSRGLCINNACVCAEGLQGSDCSQNVPNNQPTLYQCPTCYQVTVGSPRYISGPSWRLPDGPIVGLNYRGNLSVFTGNGDGEMISQGLSIDDYLPSPIIALTAGNATSFDSCGAWIMRSLTADSGKIVGFYHAETACTYVNGQTRKSGGYCVSPDGGTTFVKPNYPYNKMLDTSTPIITGQPTGEGDFSIIVRGNYYYMFFANVEDWHTGVARADRSGDAAPGTFFKYLNGQWNSPAVGGNSSKIYNVAGTQVYVHTPTQSLVSVGNANPYWNNGFMMSVSDDTLNWTYIADPIFTPDPITNLDTVMYPSFLGKTGGYDIGSAFQFYYMWIPPWSDWNHRYQITKDVTLTYVGANSSLPATKIALTTYQSDNTSEIWQSTELALAPYQAIGIVGYLMSRPYPYSFVVYDCYNYTTGDHFVGIADECFLSGSGIEVLRTLGYMWSLRVAQSIAVYRCYLGTDIFLSANTNCDGRAPAQTVPFGYVMDGPAFTATQNVLIGQGAYWKYTNKTYSSWSAQNYDDSGWSVAISPFGNGYSTRQSYFGPTSYYFRYNFTFPSGKVAKKLLLSVSSDDYAIVYLNGILVDTDPAAWHEASYWNRRVYISTAPLVSGSNTLAVQTKNSDSWAYFDLQLVAYYDTTKSARSVVEEDPAMEPEQPEKLDVQELENSDDSVEPKAQREIPKYHERNIEPRATLQTLLNMGSTWKYYNKSVPTGSWTQLSYDDSAWPSAPAPFVTGYSAYVGKTPFGATDYYFRSHFTIPAGQAASQMQVNVASDNFAIVYINGILVDSDPSAWHQATYWNRQVAVDTSIVNTGDNIITVLVKNLDQWAFFDLQIQVAYTALTVTASPSPVLIDKGSTWAFYNKSAPASTWTQATFDDSAWSTAPAPFVTGYSAYVGKTPFGATDYYFRKKFTIPTGYTVTSLYVNVASDNYAIVYINGVLVDSDPSSWHQAAYWNRQVSVDKSVVVTGSNTIAVVTKNLDQWAFFDLQLNATFSPSSTSTTGASTGTPTTTPTAAPPTAPTTAPPTAPTTRPNAPTSGANTTLIAKGSNWLFYNKTTIGSSWPQLTYDDSAWSTAPAPFVTGYSAYSASKYTPFGNTDYYFRYKFTIDSTKVVQAVYVSVASDNYALVYINNLLVDSDPASWHQATYWNRDVSVDLSSVTAGTNVIAVVVKNSDAWAFFDLQLIVNYAQSSQVANPTPTPNPIAAPANISNAYLIPKGSSWLFYNQSAPASTWIQPYFDDSAWKSAVAPFVTGYSAYVGKTPFGPTDYYFRSTFTLPVGSTLSTLQVSVASDNYAIVYINGVLVDSDTTTWHQAAYWNRQFYVNTSLIHATGSNIVAIVTKNMDQWAFFDAQIYAEFTQTATGGSSAPGVVTCAIKGQIIGGKCVCDSGWGGSDCSINLCTYTGALSTTIVIPGSFYRHIQWPTVASTPVGWFAPTYDDSWWQLNAAPFATTQYPLKTTVIAAYRHLYRKKFLIDIPYNMVIQTGTLSVASEDVHRVFINGNFIDNPIYPYLPHSGKQWNAVITFDGALLSSTSVISVEIPLVDGRWTSYFDMQLDVTFAVKTCKVSL